MTLGRFLYSPSRKRCISQDFHSQVCPFTASTTQPLRGCIVRLEMPITRSCIDVPPCQAPSPAVHRKPALGYGSGGERSPRALQSPREESRENRSSQLCPGLQSRHNSHPNESFTCLWHHPSSLPLLKSIKQTVRAERTTETAAAQHPRQVPGANTEPANSSIGETQNQTPHGVSSVLSQPPRQVLGRGSRAGPAAAASSCRPPRCSSVSSQPQPRSCCRGDLLLQEQLSPSQDSLQARQEHAGALRDHKSPWPRSSSKGIPGALGPSSLPAQPRHRAEAALGKTKSSSHQS